VVLLGVMLLGASLIVLLVQTTRLAPQQDTQTRPGLLWPDPGAASDDDPQDEIDFGDDDPDDFTPAVPYLD
jgi:hypothetical protein